MAQAGYTPIQLYYSTTGAAAPTAGNLANGELAINITDGKLYYKDNGGVVQTLAVSPTATGSANGVLYLNGSKVPTAGSALTFDGTNFATTGTASATKLIPTGGAVTGNGMYLPAANAVSITTNGADRIYIDSSGNVGIGTSSPGYRLDVQSSSATQANIQATGANSYATLRLTGNSRGGELDFYDGSTSVSAIVGHSGTKSLYFYTNGNSTLQATLDSSGNLGLGVTPSAWNAYRAFQMQAGSLLSYSTTNFRVVQNVVRTGATFNYLNNGFANYYLQGGSVGGHSWYVAPSGTAGDPITFTQAMTLDASGNLLVGTTSQLRAGLACFAGSSASLNQLVLADTVAYNASPSAQMNFVGKFDSTGVAYADYAVIRGAKTNSTDGNKEGYLIFATNDGTAATERARITSGGEVYIAGTTDQGAYNLQCNGTGVWGAGAYVNGSDERIKDDIAPIESGLDVVEKLNPVTYRYKEDWSKDQSTQTGFIAQELLIALEGKNYVNGVVQQGGSEGYYSVAYQNIIPILTKAIQELKAELDATKAEVAALKGE